MGFTTPEEEDAALARIAAAKARAEERQEATLAALQELVEGQKELREQLAAILEELVGLRGDLAALEPRA